MVTMAMVRSMACLSVWSQGEQVLCLGVQVYLSEPAGSTAADWECRIRLESRPIAMKWRESMALMV
jgi:hypothetical protein